MARVARYLVLEQPGGFTLAIGDDTYDCPPGTVVYAPWIPDGGISATRLVHLGYLAPAGAIDDDDVPEAPHGAFRMESAPTGMQRVGEPVDLGDRAPVLDGITADPEKAAVNASLQDAHDRIADLEARLASQVAPAATPGVAEVLRPADEDSADPETSVAAAGDAPAIGGGTGGDTGTGAHSSAGSPPAVPADPAE